jgi:predicted amidohydrolase YtcJ
MCINNEGVTPCCGLCPDLILHDANVITMNEHQPVVQAVACFQGRIAAVGRATIEILSAIRATVRKNVMERTVPPSSPGTP